MIRRSAAVGGRTVDATKDENAVVFTKKQQPGFETLRDALHAALDAGSVPVAAAPSADIAEQIARLAQLRDAGVLSENEFQEKKADLLRRL